MWQLVVVVATFAGPLAFVETAPAYPSREACETAWVEQRRDAWTKTLDRIEREAGHVWIDVEGRCRRD